jgi:hypothetical protein
MDDPNDLQHVFAAQRHNLETLVRQYGSVELAGRAIDDAAEAAFAGGTLVADNLGYYQQVFDVGGNPVTVRGRVVNGVVRIGSAWIAVS